MENPTEPSPDTQIDGPDSPTSPQPSDDHHLLAELQALRESYRILQSKSTALEEDLLLAQSERDEAPGRNADLAKVVGELSAERDEATGRNADLAKVVGELSAERDSFREQIDGLEASAREKEVEFANRVNEESKEKEELRNELEGFRERVENLEAEKEKRIRFLLKTSDSIRSVKECLVKVNETVEGEKLSDEVDGQDHESVESESESELESKSELRAIWEELMAIKRLAGVAELKVSEYKEMRKKEKKELEDSVVSLTEENRDINSLLRIALVEKEAVERSLNKLKGGGDQKRVALLQIAERGLQRVGFGFMMGGGTIEQPLDISSSASMGSKSDSSECDEEVVSLASTVERIMKNLRMEISQLRKALEESRSDNERLQSLTEKQAEQIAENAMYIKELENRERVLVQNVEELLTEIKETEAEVVRWREACELEVAAGKTEIDERDKVSPCELEVEAEKTEIDERNKVVAILKQELDKTKAALDISNGKLKLKEELAAAAMAAQAAAERSLQLTDSRAAGLRARIEELTRQLEEAESRERNSRRVRHICWPWRALKMNAANNANTMRNVKRMLPEMQALLH